MLPLIISRIAVSSSSFGAFFHHVTVCAGSEGALCEDGFLKSGINENQQSRMLQLERFKKFEAVAGAQPQCNQQQVRLAFLDLVAASRIVSVSPHTIMSG